MKPKTKPKGRLVNLWTLTPKARREANRKKITRRKP